MAINTELPISKVTFDDQEISLASSGEGGEEVITERYTKISTASTKALEKATDGKLFRIIVTLSRAVTITRTKISFSSDGSWTSESGDVVLAANQKLFMTPSHATTTKVYCTGGRVNEAFTFGIGGDTLATYVNVTGYSANVPYIINAYQPIIDADISSIEVQYFK